MMHLTGLILAASSAVLFVNAAPEMHQPLPQSRTISQTQLATSNATPVASRAALQHSRRVREALKRHPNQSTARLRQQGVPVVSSSYSLQQTSINLRTQDLRQPSLLTIEPTARSAQLTGVIRLNGARLLTLNGRRAEVNLSRFLKKGQNKIEVTGRYTPQDTDVQISFTSAAGEVTQSVGGSGTLNQVITLYVD